MQSYFAVVDKESDSAWGLWFPDVEGCFSAADEECDILKNALEALSLHLDGIEAPVGRSIDQISRDPDVAEALKAGAYLLAVPFVTLHHRSVRINLSLDAGIVSAIDAAAAMRGLTRSAFVAEASRNEIEGR